MLEITRQRMEQCLNILEIHDISNLTLDGIKHQWRLLAKKYHPDTAEASYRDGAKFRELKSAYDWLTDSPNFSLLPEYCSKKTTIQPRVSTNSHDRQHTKNVNTNKKRSTPYPAEEVDGRLYNLEKCVWEPVSSSTIKYIYYDSYRSFFFVIFKSSPTRVYCYLGVPYKVYSSFIVATSLGRFLNDNIKPFYKCVKMKTQVTSEEIRKWDY